MPNTLVAAALALCGLLTAPAAQAAAPPSPRLEIALANATWQPLPRGVQRVFVAPDGRTWYECRPEDAPDLTAAELKQVIAREFAQPSPQIAGAEIALFEPGGRVWFYAGQHDVLLGYDGRQWIEHAISGDTLQGRCLTRGALSDGRAHRYAGQTAWFLGRRGIFRFDGKELSYQPLLDGQVEGEEHLCLTVSPDGKVAAACENRTGALWLCRNGQWKQESVPGESSEGKPTAIALSSDQTLWYLLSGGQLRKFAVAGEARPAGEVTDLIARLKDDHFTVRQRAVQRLEALGVGVLAALDAALPGCDDLEQQSLLRQIMKSLRHGETEGGTAIGGVRIAKSSEMYVDGQGRVFVLAERIADGRTQQAGVAILQRDGGVTTLLGAPLADAWKTPDENDPWPLLVASGTQVWLPGRVTTDPPRLLDLEKKEFVASLPYKEFGWLHAVTADGRLFVSAQNPERRGVVLAYTPSARQADPPLVATRIPVEWPAFAISDDGAVWAIHQQDGLVRFDGQKWQKVAPQRRRAAGLLPGKDGMLLVVDTPESAVYRGAQEVARGALPALIEQQQELFAAAFGPGNAGQFCLPHHLALAVVTDRRGNVWCLQPPGRLVVYGGGRWHDAGEAIMRAGARQGRVEYLALVGDGSKVYVSDLRGLRDAGRSFLGEVNQGELRFSQARHVFNRDEVRVAIHDRQGALWLPGLRGEVRDGRDVITGQFACRLGQDGPLHELENVGYARLADAAGNVWLGAAWGQPIDLFQLWRDGKIVQRLSVPVADPRSMLLGDRPGSVYLWAPAGLLHLTADSPRNDHYQVGRLHLIEGAEGRLLARGYSRLGFAVASSLVEVGRRQHYVNLVPLPKPPM